MEKAQSLTIEKTLSATRDKVWKAWTDPAELAKWFAPENLTTKIGTFDLTVGGTLRITMISKDGKEHTAAGTFTEINPQSKLAFTWKWEGFDNPETKIQIEFADNNDKTHITFTHDGFADEERRDKHNEGWTSTFNKLTKQF